MDNTVQKSVEFTIVVNYTAISDERNEDVELAATTSISQDTEQEFLQFVQNVIGILDYYQFDVLENHRSDKGSLSYYISFYATDENNVVIPDYIVHFRLSTHGVKNIYKKSRNYYHDLANKHDLSGKGRQRYRFYNVVIDGKMYPTYEAALTYLEGICEKMEQGQYTF